MLTVRSPNTAQVTPPTVVLIASPSIVILSDGSSYMPSSEVRSDIISKYPELIIENNLNAIREAAIESIAQILTLALKMKLFSFESIAHEACERWSTRNDNPSNPSNPN